MGKIRRGPWDYVVLQDRSGGPLEDLGSFLTHARFLDEDIRKQDAKTVFYMTWADKSRPRTQKVIADAYSCIAAELGAYLAACVFFWFFLMLVLKGCRKCF